VSGKFAFRVGNRWLDTSGNKLRDEPSTTSLECGIEVLSKMGIESALLVPALLIPDDPRATLKLRTVCTIRVTEAAPDPLKPEASS